MAFIYLIFIVFRAMSLFPALNHKLFPSHLSTPAAVICCCQDSQIDGLSSEFPVWTWNKDGLLLSRCSLRARGPCCWGWRWNPETRDSENDRTCSWNPHRYCLLTTSRSISYSAKSTRVWDLRPKHTGSSSQGCGIISLHKLQVWKSNSFYS